VAPKATSQEDKKSRKGITLRIKHKTTEKYENPSTCISPDPPRDYNGRRFSFQN
jgi:hypothetical protein